jgi:hypothetical protein
MRLFPGFSILGLALLLSVGVGCTASDTHLTEAPIASADQPAPQFGLIDDLAGELTNTAGELTNTAGELTNSTGELTNTVVGKLGSATDLLTCSPQPHAITKTTVGPNGGTILVGTHKLVIPRGALTKEVRITAEQVTGSTNSVRFKPEGLNFRKDAALTMSYENCALVLLQKKIVYTDENLKILEVLRSLDLFRSKTVSAPIDHFSRYAIAY